MRVAHVLDGFGLGGKEILVRHLCRLQRQMGLMPVAHGILEGGPVADQLRQDGVEVVVHSQNSRWGGISALRTALRGSDVVHCHNLLATTRGAVAARLAGVPCILSTCHSHGYPSSSQTALFEFWLAARLCRKVVAVSDAAAVKLLRNRWADPSRLVRLYNGVAPPFRGEDPAGIPPKSGWTVVQLGRLHEPKDPYTLIRAAAVARRAIEDLRIWFVGDGPQMATAVALRDELGLSDVVHFWGARRNVGDYLAQADLFVLSSKSEGLPLSLLEAMAAGLPMAVADVGGMPEVLAGSEAGVAFPPQDADALAGAIIRFHAQRQKQPEWASDMKARYERNFTLERMAEAYLEIYRS